MSDDLRERVAAAMWNSRGNGDWNDATNTALIAIYRNLADAALAEIGGVRVEPLNEEERAEVINAAYEEYRKSQRGVRGQLITEWDSIESWVVQATEARILAAIEPARAIAEGRDDE